MDTDSLQPNGSRCRVELDTASRRRTGNISRSICRGSFVWR
jgi:hypothetical protein